MTAAEFDAIRNYWENTSVIDSDGDILGHGLRGMDDVPRLLAEIDRLKAEVERLSMRPCTLHGWGSCECP